MIVHGVAESAHVRQSSMKALYEEVKKADRILNY